MYRFLIQKDTYIFFGSYTQKNMVGILLHDLQDIVIVCLYFFARG